MSEIKLTIDEVIDHCERIVQSYASTNIDEIIAERGMEFTFVKRYLEHKQVAEWLKELKNLRSAMERILTRLEKKKRSDGTESDREWGKYIGYVDSIKIVKEEGGIE